VVTAGAALSLRHAGYHALDSLRMEKGYRSWGHDIFGGDTPLEAGLGFAVAWDKPGGFIGREALSKQKEQACGGGSTATRATAAGGITTLVDMPLDSVPTTISVEALQAKHAAAEGRCYVDVGFWGGVVPSNLGELALLHEAGVLGFKCFLADSGSDDFPPVSAGQMAKALSVLRGLGSPLLIHAESAEAVAAIGGGERPPVRRLPRITPPGEWRTWPWCR